MRVVTSLVLAAALMSASPASAIVIDLRQMSCEAFLKEDKDFHGQALMWLSAYALGEDDEPVMDIDKIIQNGQKLGAFCARNGGTNVMAAFDQVSK